LKGKVVRIVENKGFFFIRGDDGVERFGHHSSLLNAELNALRADDVVEFEHVDAPKGPRAVSIRLVVDRPPHDPLAEIFPGI
jgi:cold shock CspA family protein